MNISYAALAFVLTVVPAAIASEPDTLAVANVSRDTIDQTPSGWENALSKHQKAYTNYTVRYDDSGPYIHAAANSAGSWIERDIELLGADRYPILEWEWKVDRFPEVEWERNPNQDDFAIRLELVYDYRGGKWNVLNLVRKGLITSFFRGAPPVLTISYVWSREVPVDDHYQSPESSRITVIPIESGAGLTGKWLREQRILRADLNRHLAGERNVVLKKIRIRCDTESSGTTAESGIRNIRLIRDGRDHGQPSADHTK